VQRQSAIAAHSTQHTARRNRFVYFSHKEHSPMQMTPTIAVHVTTALTAVLLGPFVIWARRGRSARPVLHRGLGYA
jgi:hypothetical protein